MNWQTRIREAAYTSPSGDRFTFDYENAKREGDKKTTGFTFPDADGTFVQSLGKSGRRYPHRIFISGDNYDLDANAFESALYEDGVGRLETPLYGVIDVMPFGTIIRRDDLKTAANQAVIDVTFWETTGLVYPTQQVDPGSAVLTAVNEYNVSASESFENLIDLDSAVEQVTFKNNYLVLLAAVESQLQSIANTQDDVRNQFNAINDSINNGIDVLISQPLTLALQTTQLIQSPARALTNIEARLSAYNNLLQSIVGGSPATDPNEFTTRDLYASSYVSGSIVSVVNNQFDTKPEAIAAADALLSQFDQFVEWRDAGLATVDLIDTGEAYQQLQEAVAVAAGFLVEISFSLRQERRVVLGRNRTIIDLAAEIYKSVDDETLNFLINTNELTGSEILELPKGREIVFYI
jgi:prophage DNA circulation protein